MTTKLLRKELERVADRIYSEGEKSVRIGTFMMRHAPSLHQTARSGSDEKVIEALGEFAAKCPWLFAEETD